LVQDEAGAVLASATLTKYEPYFSVDALVEEWLAGDASRRMAVPHSETVEAVA
jgi:hypothetical protein